MKKLICVVLSIMMAVLCFAGCVDSGSSGETDTKASDLTTPLSLALVIGAHKNFPVIGFSSQWLEDSIYTACRTYGEINVIVSEKIPEVQTNIRFEKTDKNLTEKKHKQLAQSNAQAVYNLLPALKAKTGEVDLLRSLDLAADALSASSSTRRELYIYDSGLCTAGILSQLTEDYIGADHKEIADKLSLMGALPELEGVTVYFQGLGCVAGEQEALPPSVKKNLKSMWNEILIRSGAAEVIFDTTPVTGEEGTDLPEVTVLDFPEDKLILDDNTLIKFDDRTIKFKADSAEFIDASGAEVVLRPVAAVLIENPSVTVYIAGTTATVGVTEDTPVTGIELSFDRAQACKDMLVAMGVRDSQLICKGLGCADNALKTDDCDAEGNLIEEKAVLNRAIYIFTTTSVTAADLGLS